MVSINEFIEFGSRFLLAGGFWLARRVPQYGFLRAILEQVLIQSASATGQGSGRPLLAHIQCLERARVARLGQSFYEWAGIVPLRHLPVTRYPYRQGEAGVSTVK